MSQTNRQSLVERYALPPQEIEKRSFAMIDSLVSPQLPELLPHPEWPVIRRIVHTTGDPSLAGAVRLSVGALQAGIDAVRGGASIVTDIRMVEAGISRALAERFQCRIFCAIDAPEVVDRAREKGITRAVAAMRWLASQPGGSNTRSLLDGAVVAIGNAPTALLALLDIVDQELACPALIIGMPVGFVAAAESKEELAKRQTPYITLPGTRGGSTIAVATVNAILRLAAANTRSSANTGS